MKRLYLLLIVNLFFSVIAISLSGYTLLRFGEANAAKHPGENSIKKYQDLSDSETKVIEKQIAENRQTQQNLFDAIRALEQTQDVKINEQRETLGKISEILDARLHCPQLAVIQENTEQIANLHLNLANLQLRVANAMAAERKNGSTYLPTSSTGFNVLKTRIGALTCSIKDVKDHANNSKLTLSIGNPMFAGLSGFDATLKYGPLHDGQVDLEKQKTQKFKFITELEAGTWFDQEVVLEGIKPSELGYLIITDVELSGIRLTRAK